MTNQEEAGPHLTRTFTVAELDAIGVPFKCPGPDSPNPNRLAVELHCEQVDSLRWVSVHELIFRAPDDGKTYRVHYEQGLTEHQDSVDPWNDETTITATEVKPRQVTVERWLPVEATPVTHAPIVRQAAEHCHTDHTDDEALAFTEDRAFIEDRAKRLDICADYMEKWPGDAQMNSPFKQGGYAVACAILGVTP
jgi:hypothetical protein